MIYQPIAGWLLDITEIRWDQLVGSVLPMRERRVRDAVIWMIRQRSLDTRAEPYSVMGIAARFQCSGDTVREAYERHSERLDTIERAVAQRRRQ